MWLSTQFFSFLQWWSHATIFLFQDFFCFFICCVVYPCSYRGVLYSTLLRPRRPRKNVHSICAAISRSDWVRSSYQPNLSKIRHTYCQHYEKQILLQLKLEALTYVCLVKQPFYSAQQSFCPRRPRYILRSNLTPTF